MVTLIGGLMLALIGMALLGLGGYVYLDAPEYGLDPQKWALISVVVPVFGFFAYLFEREEQTPDSGRDEMFVDGAFEVHKSRADDAPFVSDPDDPEERDE